MKYNGVSAMGGKSVSAIGFGCWSLGGGSGWLGSSNSASTATVHRALDVGVTFFDTAPVYGFGESERILGEALRGRRDEVTLASKCGLVWDDTRTIRRDLSAAAIARDVDTSLARLGVDHLDLLQLHWPDHNTPLEETAHALEKLVQAGKARHVGVANFSLADTRSLSMMIPLASYQGLYNLLERNPGHYHGIPLEYQSEREIMPYCAQAGIAFVPYSPLFQGLLAGEFGSEARFGEGDVRAKNPKLQGVTFTRYAAAVEALKVVATEADLSLGSLALGWLCGKEQVTTVICGAQYPEQIAANAAAADVNISPDHRQRIDEILTRHGILPD